ncbi:PREDICTED: ankyrin and armadillo repeat-containing protein-like [Branchiostoma belcheri]|uniref:Ankyrin and armadillo repeat-containing protein-like n=1 Tax=Branchiostoma belcheri TaxID=7741 RepID=A0A6P4ZWI1_BRABE|nr:PREDICTED: ankyrin and armadillo repeat-containing protein-like [Branchiostoma belcheri]
MNEVDEQGWGHVHHAAFNGYVKSVERFVTAMEDQLEFTTQDNLHSTPLLCATMSGNIEMIQKLLDLGAQIDYKDNRNHGVVEIAATKNFVETLEFFIKLDNPKLPVWKNLIKFLSSSEDEEAEAAGKVLRILTTATQDGPSPNLEPFVDSDGVLAIVKVITGFVGEEAKIQAFNVLVNIIENDRVKQQVLKGGGIPPSVKLLKTENKGLLFPLLIVLKELCKEKQYADPVVANGAIPAIVKVCQTVNDNDVFVQAIDALGNIAESDPDHRTTVGGTPGLFSTLVNLFEDCTSKALVLSLTMAIGKMVRGDKNNQERYVNEYGASPLIMLVRVRNKDIQLSAIEALYCLADGNDFAQKAILEEGAVMPLIQLLKRTRAPDVQEMSAMALWALAGDDLNERRSMAGMMGVPLLIEFVTSLSETLHYIGAEGLAVLAQGPHSKATLIGHANGVQPLVRLLKSDKEYIVACAMNAIRHLCVGTGYVPHPKNQATVQQARGIKSLIALMVNSRNELIQVQAALTLACAALANKENEEHIAENLDFSFIHILRLLYSENEQVKLLAGEALAAFAFNNVAQQREIAESGGVRMHNFLTFLESKDEYCRCSGAFQIVVLARIVPDEDQASSSAIGIKLLVDLLEFSQKEQIQALTCDCLARLAHTRAGVPAAIVSINGVELLCRLMMSQTEQVRYCAAVALGYLTFDHTAERQLLRRCREQPYLVKVLLYHTRYGKISPSFLEGWNHCKRIGLPPIPEKPKFITAKDSITYLSSIKEQPPHARPLTILSMGADTATGETATTSRHHSSPLGLFRDDRTATNVTGRSSRVSRATATFPQNTPRSEADITPAETPKNEDAPMAVQDG